MAEKNRTFELFWWIPGGTGFNYTTLVAADGEDVRVQAVRVMANLMQEGATEILIKQK